MMLLAWLVAHWRLAALGAAGAGAGVLLALWRLEAGEAARLRAQLSAAQAAGAMAQAHAAAAVSAGQTVAAGAARDAQTRDIHAENQDAIQAAPGSAQGLDRDLNAAGRRGLCAYGVYAADPACVQLRGAGPGQRPDADPAHAPAAG